MTPRTDLLNRIYVPASMGAETLYPDFDPDYHLGIIYGIHSKKYRPVMSEDEGVQNREPVTADIMQQVVDDAVWCPWRLKKDGFTANGFGVAYMGRVRGYDDGKFYLTLRGGAVPMKGIRTYTDLIELVILANG